MPSPDDPWRRPADVELDVVAGPTAVTSPTPKAVEAARRGAVLLRLVAVVIFVLGLTGPVIINYWSEEPGMGVSGQRTRFGYTLQAVAWPASIAGLILAASVAMSVWAAVLVERTDRAALTAPAS